MLIAGDIGGTKTDLAIYSREAGPHAALAGAAAYGLESLHKANPGMLQERMSS